jgi:hypothetical protein
MALQYDVNNVVNDGADAWALFIALMDTITGCDIYAYGNSVDGRVVGGGGFDATKLRDTANAWVELTLPGGAGTLGIQRGDQSAGTNTHWWVRWSKAAQSITGGSGTQMDDFIATDTNGINILGTGSGGSTARLFMADNASPGWRFHTVAFDTSPWGAWFSCHEIGSGTARTLFEIEPVAAHTDDQVPYVFTASYRGDSEIGIYTLVSVYYFSGAKTRQRHGLPGASTLPCFCPYGNGDPGVIMPRGTALNPYDSKDELTYLTWYTYSSGSYRKGQSLMTAWAGYDRPSAHTYNVDSDSNDRFCVGDLALPWPGGVVADI